MALALYRKYRPATFSEVVGQEHVTDPLRTALAAGRVNHAYLFSGPRGCGKTSSARILARSLNCVHGPTPDPCGECPSCIALAPEGPGSLDVVELDAASHGGVDDTRDLRDKAFYMPAESRYRVFIIDEAHMVTTQGFNALLKIVEEPPEHLVFIFATTEPDKVLTTIRSRTHHYPFRLIPPATLRSLLERLTAEEGAVVDPAVLPLVIRAGGGSARDSLSLLDQLLAGAGPEGVTYRHAVALLGVTDAALIDEVVDAMAAADGASVFGAVDRVVEAGHDPRRFAADLLQRLRDLVIISAVPDAAGKGLIDAPEDQLTIMVGEAERIGMASLTRMAEVLHTGLVEMRGTTSPRLVLELLCARMLLPGASTGDAALLQRLERIERRMEIAAGPAPETQAAPPQRGAAAEQRPGQSRSPLTGAPADHTRPERAADTPHATRPSPTSPPVTPPGANGAGSATANAGRATPSGSGEAAKAHAGAALGLPVPPTLSSRRPAPSTTPPSSEPPGESAGSKGSAEPVVRQEKSDQRATGPAPQTQQEPTPPPAQEPSAPLQPASAASPEKSPTAAADIDVTDVRRVWPEVLKNVKGQRRTTSILLESATVIGVESGVLLLSMPSAGMARRVVEPANADLLRIALRQVLGVEWTIRCQSGDGTAPAAPTGSTGGPPSPSLGSGAGPEDIAPPLPPEPVPEDPADDIPDDYDEPPDPAAASTVRDPEEVAIALLTTQLGARRLDPTA